MKKLLVVLLALTVIGVFAFADDAAAPTLTISGSGQTGVQFTGGNGADFSAQLWSSNNGTIGDAWVDFVYGGANAGGKIELYASNGAKGEAANVNSATPVGIDVLSGWWKPVSMLKVNMGWNYGSTYSTPIEGWANGGYGVQFALTPIDGLTAALDLDVAQTAATAKFDASKGVGFDLQYALKDIATVGFDYDLGSKLLNAGVNVVAVANLTAQVDLQYDTDASKYKAEEQFAYAMGALKPGIWLGEASMAGMQKWSAKPWCNYTLGAATLSAYFQYNEDATWVAGPNASWTIDKNAIYAYADYHDSGAYDLGIRYVVSF